MGDPVGIYTKMLVTNCDFQTKILFVLSKILLLN